MINKSIFLSSTLILASVVVAQTDAQLRDPEYLIKFHNGLVAKHNKVIKMYIDLNNSNSELSNRYAELSNRYKNLAQQQNNIITGDPQSQQKLNEALAREAVLERKINQASAGPNAIE